MNEASKASQCELCTKLIKFLKLAWPLSKMTVCSQTFVTLLAEFKNLGQRWNSQLGSNFKKWTPIFESDGFSTLAVSLLSFTRSKKFLEVTTKFKKSSTRNQFKKNLSFALSFILVLSELDLNSVYYYSFLFRSYQSSFSISRAFCPTRVFRIPKSFKPNYFRDKGTYKNSKLSHMNDDLSSWCQYVACPELPYSHFQIEKTHYYPLNRYLRCAGSNPQFIDSRFSALIRPDEKKKKPKKYCERRGKPDNGTHFFVLPFQFSKFHPLRANNLRRTSSQLF